MYKPKMFLNNTGIRKYKKLLAHLITSLLASLSTSTLQNSRKKLKKKWLRVNLGS